MRISRSIPLLVLAMMASLAACNSVTGVGDLTFDRQTSGSGATGGTSNGTGGMGQGVGGAPVGVGGSFGVGAGGSSMPACQFATNLPPSACVDCARAFCCDIAKQCDVDPSCAACLTNGPGCNTSDPVFLQTYGCLEQHCGAPCSSASVGAGGASSSTQGGGPSAGGTASSTMGGGPDCSMMGRGACDTCCAAQYPTGAQSFVGIARGCACETAVSGECAGPVQCGSNTTCDAKWSEPGCYGCPAFGTCVNDSCFQGDPCGDYAGCISTCPAN